MFCFTFEQSYFGCLSVDIEHEKPLFERDEIAARVSIPFDTRVDISALY
jgi:hypothetical protein